jgi:hypothetical protein
MKVFQILKLTPMKTIQTHSAQIHNPIDPQIIVKHGDSPTAIILAVAILLAILFQSMTRLIAVILKRQK